MGKMNYNNLSKYSDQIRMNWIDAIEEYIIIVLRKLSLSWIENMVVI